MSLSTNPTEFTDVFQWEGTLEGKLHLDIDKRVPPVVLPVRKIPFSMKEPLQKEIERLVERRILEPVNMPRLGFINGYCKKR